LASLPNRAIDCSRKTTTIRYDLPVSSHLTINLYNKVGEEVATLVDETQDAVFKSVVVNADNYASGVYFYRILVGEFSGVRKMIGTIDDSASLMNDGGRMEHQSPPESSDCLF